MSNNPPQFIVSCFHMNRSICLPSRASSHRNKFTESLILYTTRVKVCTQSQQKWKDKVCPYPQNPPWQRLWAGYEIASPAQQIIIFIIFITVTSLNQSTRKQLIAQTPKINTFLIEINSIKAHWRNKADTSSILSPYWNWEDKSTMQK